MAGFNKDHWQKEHSPDAAAIIRECASDYVYQLDTAEALADITAANYFKHETLGVVKVGDFIRVIKPSANQQSWFGVTNKQLVDGVPTLTIAPTAALA